VTDSLEGHYCDTGSHPDQTWVHANRRNSGGASGVAEAKTALERLTPGRRREYSDHIADAKRADTKMSRIEKILPMRDRNFLSCHQR
jgi:hypothetical protein